MLGIAVLPIPLTFVLFPFYGIVTGTPSEAYGLPVAYFLYGLANVGAVSVLYRLLTPEERAAVFRFERPSVAELGAALVMFPVGVVVYLVTSRLSGALGYELQGLSYSLSDPMAVALVIAGAVVVAPLTEEILYRGLILGTLLSHGFGIAMSVALTTGLFALIHLPNFGVAGTLFISVWGLLPALLRIRFDNLSGAVFMHGLNNTYAYLVVVALGVA
jgi:membrane protease YdiL (CAAX protease family)